MTTGSRGRRVMVGVNGWGSARGLLNKFAYWREGCASALSFTMTLNCKFKYHESINSPLVRILDFFSSIQVWVTHACHPFFSAGNISQSPDQSHHHHHHHHEHNHGANEHGHTHEFMSNPGLWLERDKLIKRGDWKQVSCSLKIPCKPLK